MPCCSQTSPSEALSVVYLALTGPTCPGLPDALPASPARQPTACVNRGAWCQIEESPSGPLKSPALLLRMHLLLGSVAGARWLRLRVCVKRGAAGLGEW